MKPELRLIAATLLALAACGTSPDPVFDAGSVGALDATSLDAATLLDAAASVDATSPSLDAGLVERADGGSVPGSDAGFSGVCSNELGAALTEGFGRLDGVVYSVIQPGDGTCPPPNGTHLVVQVIMNGDVYRMVVNVHSDRAGTDQRVSFARIDHALDPPWSEGWHQPVTLDYPTLGLHSGSFATMEEGPLAAALTADLHPGDAISFYAQSGAGRPESAHLIHRNGSGKDGAIVLHPTSGTPKFLTFHFQDQSF